MGFLGVKNRAKTVERALESRQVSRQQKISKEGGATINNGTPPLLVVLCARSVGAIRRGQINGRHLPRDIPIPVLALENSLTSPAVAISDKPAVRRVRKT